MKRWIPRIWRPLDRRTVLRGLLGGAAVSVALPRLMAFSDARADTTIYPRRFGLFYWGNGNLPERWDPTLEGPDWELTEQLAPLAPVKDLITVLTGLEVKVPNEVPHGSGLAGILSGAPMLRSDDGDTFALPSIDQLIAESIGGDTIYRSLQTAASRITGQSYNGPNSRNPAEYDPYLFFDRIFGAGFREPGEEGVVDPTLGLRRSVLDAVMEDTHALKAKVGYEDQVRLEQHLEGIRELEQRLARLQEDPPNLESCARPEAPLESYPDIDGRPQLSAINGVMSQMLAMTLACDQTRVVAHYFSEGVNNLLFPNAPAGHHDLTHDEPDPQEEVHKIVVQIMEELAVFIGALEAIPEGDGTLLDSCAVLATSEISLGRTHSLTDYPLILAGGAGGRLVQGTHIRSLGGDNTSKVILSILRALDIDAASFGVDEAEATEGFSEIEL